MQSVRNELKWADGKAVKNEMDLMVCRVSPIFHLFKSRSVHYLFFIFFKKRL